MKAYQYNNRLTVPLLIFTMFVIASLACNSIAPMSTPSPNITTLTATTKTPENTRYPDAPIPTDTPKPTNTPEPVPTATDNNPIPPPTRDQIVNSLFANGFTNGDNDKHFKNLTNNMIAFLGNGCDFSIEITFDSNHSQNDQVKIARNILVGLYPKGIITQYDTYILELSNNALNGGSPLAAPTGEIGGYMITMSNEPYAAGGVLIGIFNPKK